MQSAQTPAAKAVGCGGFLEVAASWESDLLFFAQTPAMTNRTKVQWPVRMEPFKRANSTTHCGRTLHLRSSAGTCRLHWSPAICAALLSVINATPSKNGQSKNSTL